MTYFEDLSKERLYRLAEDLVAAIAAAAWRDNKGKPNLFGPTNHMIAAVHAFKAYTHDPCPECGKSRREL